MPTQVNLGASRSEGAAKTEQKPDMSAREALARKLTNSPVTSKHTPGAMTKAEALAVAWTGIEALARMGAAKLYRSPKNGRVWVELLETELTGKDGLKALAEAKP